MNRNFTDEEDKPEEDVSDNKMTWQKPEFIIFDIDKTEGGSGSVSESGCGCGLFS